MSELREEGALGPLITEAHRHIPQGRSSRG